LVVDDELSMRELLEITFNAEGFEVALADSGQSAVDCLREDNFDLVITDIRMDEVDGLEVLRACKAKNPDTVVIIISAYASTETAVEAMREGAYDYLPKPFDINDLLAVVREALARGIAPTDEAGYVEEATNYRLHYGALVGESPQMQKIYHLTKQVATATSNVLVTGESGTGKELVARAVHLNSPRQKMPFMVVHCGGIPETLMESELFGHKKGAFTGATTEKIGLFQAADQGTIFLDEISELSPTIQVKLLRVVQDKTFKMVGGTEDLQVDVRIISATNRDLEQEVMAGRFREDLFFRLNVLPLRLPPLRERPEDIPLLAQYFLDKYAKDMDKDLKRISTYALEILKGYNFPGNVRELENIIERSVAMETSSIVLPESLTLSAFKTHIDSIGGAEEGMDVALMQPEFKEGFNLDRYLSEVEKELLAKALRESGEVRQKAARMLGITQRSLRYRLGKHDPDRPDRDGEE
jgi:two-component system response regulator PilR (NtrC family)